MVLEGWENLRNRVSGLYSKATSAFLIHEEAIELLESMCAKHNISLSRHIYEDYMKLK